MDNKSGRYGKPKRKRGKRGRRGGAHENFWNSPEEGAAEERGQHGTPKFIIFFFMTLAY